MAYGVPGDTSSQIKQAQDAAYRGATQYLDPQWKKANNDLSVELANKGVMEGSHAYDQAKNLQGLQQQQAYDAAQTSAVQTGNALQGQLYAQGVAGANLNNSAIAQQLQQQAYLATLPLNELNALRSGTQINNPTFNAAPRADAASTDVSGNVYKSAQMQNDSSNAFMNGLFSLGAAAIPLASDRRLKRDIEQIGETPVMKLPLYLFRYIWDDILHVGVMAQDVLKVKPSAVQHRGRFMMVDYGQIS